MLNYEPKYFYAFPEKEEKVKEPPKEQKQKYYVELKLRYEGAGEVAVKGSIEQLGSWQEVKMVMKKQGEGVLVSDPIVTNLPYFQYKYAIVDGDTVVKYEQGINRIADLRILEGHSHEEKLINFGHKFGGFHEVFSPRSVKHIFITDVWETFNLKFTLFYPFDLKPEEEMFLCIDRLGSQQIPMDSSKVYEKWRFPKYGQEMKLLECKVSIPNTRSGPFGQFDEFSGAQYIQYQYQKVNKDKNQVVVERELKRLLHIRNPDSYVGKENDEQFEEFYFLNGGFNITDGAFMCCFNVSEIGNHGIIVGPYPANQRDVAKIAEKKVQAVINLQTSQEIRQRCLNHEQVEFFYRESGIHKYQHIPIHEDSFNIGLLEAALTLNHFLNDLNLRVYIHCTSSVSRAPAVICLYLCLFAKTKDWQEPLKVAYLVKNFHPPTFLNVRAIIDVIAQNKQKIDPSAEIPEDPIAEGNNGYQSWINDRANVMRLGWPEKKPEPQQSTQESENITEPLEEEPPKQSLMEMIKQNFPYLVKYQIKEQTMTETQKQDKPFFYSKLLSWLLILATFIATVLIFIFPDSFSTYISNYQVTKNYKNEPFDFYLEVESSSCEIFEVYIQPYRLDAQPGEGKCKFSMNEENKYKMIKEIEESDQQKVLKKLTFGRNGKTFNDYKGSFVLKFKSYQYEKGRSLIEYDTTFGGLKSIQIDKGSSRRLLNSISEDLFYGVPPDNEYTKIVKMELDSDLLTKQGVIQYNYLDQQGKKCVLRANMAYGQMKAAVISFTVTLCSGWTTSNIESNGQTNEILFFTGPDNVKNKVYSKQDFENYLTTISKPNPFTGAGGSSSTTVSPAKRLYIELQKYKYGKMVFWQPVYSDRYDAMEPTQLKELIDFDDVTFEFTKNYQKERVTSYYGPFQVISQMGMLYFVFRALFNFGYYVVFNQSIRQNLVYKDPDCPQIIDISDFSDPIDHFYRAHHQLPFFKQLTFLFNLDLCISNAISVLVFQFLRLQEITSLLKTKFEIAENLQLINIQIQEQLKQKKADHIRRFKISQEIEEEIKKLKIGHKRQQEEMRKLEKEAQEEMEKWKLEEEVIKKRRKEILRRKAEAQRRQREAEKKKREEAAKKPPGMKATTNSRLCASNEGAEKVLTGQRQNKWCVHFTPGSTYLRIELDYPIDLMIHGYTFMLGNDDSTRDPKEWRVEVLKKDGSTYTENHSYTSSNRSRHAESEYKLDESMVTKQVTFVFERTFGSSIVQLSNVNLDIKPQF